MKNIGTTLGLWWISTFDKSQFLFKSLKILPIYIRYLFYILLVTTLYFTITKLGAIIDVRSYTSIPVFIQSLLILIGLGIKILSILFTIGIVNYESLYSSNFDIDSHLQEQKQKIEYIKNNKKQWWRLRNMHGLLRILVYIGVWSFSYLIIEDILISAFFNVYPNPSKEIYIKFLYDYDFIIKCFIGIYLILVFILDYFVRKNQKSKKFPQETKLKNNAFPQETKKDDKKKFPQETSNRS